MPITIDEAILSLAEAAKELPLCRRGRAAHVSCLYRWSTIGCRGVLLETLQVGGTRCTSRECCNDSSISSLSPGSPVTPAVANPDKCRRANLGTTSTAGRGGRSQAVRDGSLMAGSSHRDSPRARPRRAPSPVISRPLRTRMEFRADARTTEVVSDRVVSNLASAPGARPQGPVRTRVCLRGRPTATAALTT